MTKNLSQRLTTSLAELGELGDFGVGRLLGEDLAPDTRDRAAACAARRWARLSSCLVARPHRERIERGADAHHDADRPAGDLRGQRQAVGARLVHGLHQPPPALRVIVAVGEQEPDRTAGLCAQLSSSSAAHRPRRRNRCSCRKRRRRRRPAPSRCRQARRRRRRATAPTRRPASCANRCARH